MLLSVTSAMVVPREEMTSVVARLLRPMTGNDKTKAKGKQMQQV